MIRRKIVRLFRWVGMGLAGLLLLLIILIQLPPVQQYGVNRATQWLSDTLHAEVSIGKFRWVGLNQLELGAVRFMTPEKDTLAVIGDLSLDAFLMPLLRNQVIVEELILKDVWINLRRSADSSWNYGFITEAFARDTPSTQESTPPAAWNIQADRLYLQNIYFTYSDATNQSDLITSLGALSLTSSRLDLMRQTLDINELNLSEPYVEYTSRNVSASTPSGPSNPTPLAFPDLGWNISLKKTQLKEGNIIYQAVSTDTLSASAFNPNNISLSELHWGIREITLDSVNMQLAIDSLSLSDHSGLVLNALKTETAFSDSLSYVRNFSLQTAQSSLRLDAELTYPTLSALLEPSLTQQREITLALLMKESAISPQDINRFAPGTFPDTLNEFITLDLEAKGNYDQLYLNTISVRQGQLAYMSLSGQLEDLPDIRQTGIDLSLDSVNTDYEGLAAILPQGSLPEGVRSWGKILLKGSLKGNADSLALPALQLLTANGPRLYMQAGATSVFDTEKSRYQLVIDSLISQGKDLIGLTYEPLPVKLENIGLLTLKGSFEGTRYDFESGWDLDSDVGELDIGLIGDFDSAYSNGIYSSSIKLKQFDLGKVLDDRRLGKASIDATLDGKGVQAKDWDTELDAVLSQFSFEDYTYDNLEIHGQLVPFAFEGNISTDDPNLKLYWEGRLPLDDTSNAFAFSLQLDTLNFMPLGLHETPLGLSLNLTSDVRDYRPDDLDGNLLIRDFIISDRIQSYHLDSLLVVSDVGKNQDNRLAVESELIRMGINGRFTLSEVPSVIQQWMTRYFPVDQLTSVNDSLLIENDSTFLQAFIHLDDPTALTDIVLKDLSRLDTFFFNFSFDNRKDLWMLDASLPIIEYGPYRIDSLKLLSSANQRRLRTHLTARNVTQDSNIHLPNPTFTSIFRHDSLQFDLVSYDTIDHPIWELGGTLAYIDSMFHYTFDPVIRLDNQDWEVRHEAPVVYLPEKRWQMSPLTFSNNGSKVTLLSQGNFVDSTSNAQIDFTQFEIGNLNALLNYKPNYLTGTFNGRANAQDLLTSLSFTSDLTLDNWIVDSVTIGTLTLQAEQMQNRSLISLMSQLQGSGNELEITGVYQVDEQTFEAYADVSAFQMKSLDPFLKGFIHDSEGALTGTFDLKGSASQPLLTGSLTFDGVKTIVDYAGTPYEIESGNLSFTEKKIGFNNILMRDEENRQATLSGEVRHQYFNDIVLDLDFNTDRFQFLNTTSKDNELFYGTLIMQTDLSLEGPATQPSIMINAKTQPNTKFYVVPLSDEQAITENDFILYGKPRLDSAGRDTAYLNRYQVTSPGLDLLLNLIMTPDAGLEIMMDPLTGDKLFCKGSSNLTVDMDPSGELSIIGTYEITEGQYALNYEQLVKREFSILPNSKISFSGDPLQAQMDITAGYQTRVPLADLVSDQVAGSTASLAGFRADVQVQMNIKGDLADPALTFDIVLLGNPQGATADAARTRLQQLRSNETELNTQVFGLLLFNSFIGGQSGGQSLASTGQSVVLSSVSKLISNQLNKLAGSVLKGFEFNLGVDAYKPGVAGENGVTTEVQLGVSKRLFNDRLKVQVGGNLNVGAAGDEPTTLTAFTGDFVLEYRLTPGGNYLLRVYRRSDYDALNEGNVTRTGAGISIRKTLKNKQKERKE